MGNSPESSGRAAGGDEATAPPVIPITIKPVEGGYFVTVRGDWKIEPGTAVLMTEESARNIIRRVVDLEEALREEKARVEWERAKKDLAGVNYDRWKIYGFLGADSDWDESLAGVGMQFYRSKHFFIFGSAGRDTQGDGRAQAGVGISLP